MCVNYTPTRRDQIAAKFQALDQTGEEWRPETWQDYRAPFITHDALKRRRAQLGTYGMIPKNQIPVGSKRFSTMNARAETIGELRSFAKSWRTNQRCLVPLQNFFEPNYENGKAERWQIGIEDASDFAVAGLYRIWDEPDGQQSFSFTQITINADEHPLMRRFHQPGDEKRALVILHEEDYDDWLSCTNPEIARAYLTLFPAEKMWARPAPIKSPQTLKTDLDASRDKVETNLPIQLTLL
ncbi:SOS response-associated peptidase [Undibacterium fentianense]|uniref:Abasic site processing protein n=1 Tax=Undibacterium fentianense TaxID=2828728 RepID=A0A941ID70_9BURK|nr:SOS response-associated peptidase family protein [Undibacterium fentianense]MBR7800989.1 SOS response-associated peptidase family protein [Undibacterium fentianense]